MAEEVKVLGMFEVAKEVKVLDTSRWR